MDMNYLLWLQGLRESSNGALDGFFAWYSDLLFTPWPLIIVCLIYWVWNKRMGEIFFSARALGEYLNGMLKLTACVYRPWIRDPRIVPVGDSIRTATGYSFPSGHSTAAAYYFGTGAVWQWKKRRWLSILLIFLLLLILFSRNYLGVHTPQDVLTGSVLTMILVLLIFRLQTLVEMGVVTDSERFLGALTMVVMGAIYIAVKTYPMELADGALIVDPEKMKPDTYAAFGNLVGTAAGLYMERRWIKLAETKEKAKRLIFAVIACVPLYFMVKYLRSALIPGMGKTAAGFTAHFFIMLYCLVLAPACMKKLEKQAEPTANRQAA